MSTGEPAARRLIRLKPAQKTQVLGDCDVDAVALEIDDQGRVTDFRLELGRGYEIVWLVPITPNGHLRLIRIGYVTVDMDPELLIDPCAVDFGPEEWNGPLGQVAGGGVLEHVRVELTRSPATYRCTAVVSAETYVLAYGESET